MAKGDSKLSDNSKSKTYLSARFTADQRYARSSGIKTKKKIATSFSEMKSQASEIESASNAWSEYRRKWSEANGAEWGDGVGWAYPKKPTVPTASELSKAYPAGAVYRRAESLAYDNSANYEYSSGYSKIGKEALNQLKKGVNYNTVDKRITQKIKKFDNEMFKKHMWD